MLHPKWLIALVLSTSASFAQMANATPPKALSAPTTIPIIFTSAISSDKSHVGEKVYARTSQEVRLSNGFVIPSGARVFGHVTEARPFVYDKTPYAHQKQGTLSFHLDSITVAGESIPLNVMVRAMADPLASWGAREPGPSDMDPDETVTQIGGDQLTPSRSEVIDRNGDVVAYNKHGGVFAHLIANGRCHASDIEVSVDIYSASACGLYGFTNVSALELGSPTIPSTVTLVSTRTSPKVWKHSTALLEVVAGPQAFAAR